MVGERSRSDSGFSEVTEKLTEDQEDRLPDVMKGGRGGAREAKSSGEDSWGRDVSSLAAKRRKESAVGSGRNFDIWGRDTGPPPRQKRSGANQEVNPAER